MLDNWFVQKIVFPRFFSITAAVLVIAILSAGIVRAEEGGKELEDGMPQFMAQLASAAAKIDSFHTVFVQEKELSLFAETMVFHGELVVVRPDRLRWEFTDPVPSVLILNGNKGLRCSEKAAPVGFNLKTDPIMRSVAEQLWLWLGGDYSRLSDSFSLAQKDEASLLITPKDPAVLEFIEQIMISFDPHTMQPQEVEIREPGGDLTRLRFTDYTFNLELTDQLFDRCKAPSDNDS